MGVGKIFKVLIIIVVCVIIGAMVINVIVPNAVSGLIDATEGMMYKASGISFDFNGNGTAGSDSSGSSDFTGSSTAGDAADELGTVEGFK